MNDKLLLPLRSHWFCPFMPVACTSFTGLTSGNAKKPQSVPHPHKRQTPKSNRTSDSRLAMRDGENYRMCCFTSRPSFQPYRKLTCGSRVAGVSTNVKDAAAKVSRQTIVVTINEAPLTGLCGCFPANLQNTCLSVCVSLIMPLRFNALWRATLSLSPYLFYRTPYHIFIND